MKWKQVRRREDRQQPSRGSYQDWKPQIARDCHNRCVYCAISDSVIGVGIRFFTVDHFRPKSAFKDAEATIWNLFYCCAVCNTYKGDDWQGDITDAQKDVGYLDPSSHDYNSYFIVNQSGVVSSGLASARYMIEKINLNRGQLIYRRRAHKFYQWIREINHLTRGLMANADEEELRHLLDVMLKVSDLRDRLDNSRIEAKDYKRT